MNDEIRMSNDELPIGWAQSKIGNLCSLKNGRAFKPTEWTTSGLPIVRIQNLNNPKSSYNHFAGEPEPRYHLLGGELLFAWSGTPGTSFGAHVWRGAEAVLNQHIFRVDFDAENMDKRFFRYAINQKLDELIDVEHGGVGLHHVTKGTFEGTEIKVPPLAEQKRIADKLEAVLGRVDACRACLDRVPALLKRFRQSVLAAATSGKLTEEWRMTNGVNDEWENLKLGQLVAEPLRNGKSVRDGKGIPVLRLTALRGGKFDWREAKQGDWTGLDPTRFFVKDGDFLIIRGNGSQDLVGRGCLAENPPDEMAFPDTLIRIRPDKDKLLPSYLVIVWNTSEVRSQIEQAAKTTTGLWKVAQGDLESISIPLPPLPEQQEIVRRVEDLFAFADRIEARLATAQKTVERLTPATLAKAFRGELVPQDLNDEPASTLLERLRCPSDMTPAKAKRAKCS